MIILFHWYQNQGGEFSINSFQTGSIVSIQRIAFNDLDNDGDLDVVASGSGLSFYKNNDSVLQLDSNLDDNNYSEVYFDDLTGDGFNEILVERQNQVFVFTNSGEENNLNFDNGSQLISSSTFSINRMIIPYRFRW